LVRYSSIWLMVFRKTSPVPRIWNMNGISFRLTSSDREATYSLVVFVVIMVFINIFPLCSKFCMCLPRKNLGRISDTCNSNYQKVTDLYLLIFLAGFYTSTIIGIASVNSVEIQDCC